jgi:hypothetical protein
MTIKRLYLISIVTLLAIVTYLFATTGKTEAILVSSDYYYVAGYMMPQAVEIPLEEAFKNPEGVTCLEDIGCQRLLGDDIQYFYPSEHIGSTEIQVDVQGICSQGMDAFQVYKETVTLYRFSVISIPFFHYVDTVVGYPEWEFICEKNENPG